MHLRTSDAAQLVSRTVRDLARSTHFPIAFGGVAADDAIRVSTVVGTRSRMLDDLVVHATRGLGGRAYVERRPRLTLDYRTARGITHDYDRAILGEGIATLFAVPVVAAGRTRAMLYCASWSESAIDESVARPALDAASTLATELRIRDEVERRLALEVNAQPAGEIDPAIREELRESYAELRTISTLVSDESVRTRLKELESRLAALSRPAKSGPDPQVRLSPREIDVLACAALGHTNNEIASTLSLKEATIKSYLASAMAKLDASTRHAAVAKARLAGMLP